jgi:dihydroorotase
MPNTNPTIDDVTIVEYIKSKSQNFPVKIHISAAITKNRKGEFLTPMLELAEAGVVYFTDDGSCVSSAEVMKRAFEYAAPKDFLLAQHCEEHTLTQNFSMNESKLSTKLGLKGYPRVAEEIIINRDIKLSNYLGNRRYHIQHLSTKEALNEVRVSKLNGLRVSCEITPHHLMLTEDNISSYDTNYKMNPPLRTQEDIEALIEGLKDGTIDCIASDHAPHSQEECEVEFENAPNGIIGLETQLGIVLTLLYHKHKFNLRDIISLFSVNPRKIIGLEQIKIKVGERANLTIFSPDKEWIVDKNKFKSKGRNTPFDKMKLIGKPEYIINNNQLIKSYL